MGKALYRKYRSRSWDDVIGQEPVVATLKNATASGKVSHAYLFSGPRGTGKTSVARLLAHQINELDYSEDGSHIDIIEIDAASNTGVDDIRDLREKVSVAPALAKYKVYIIDEVHMLSKSAFNALLKTLEEPPAHVIFILATTDPQKLPETIVSRTQHFSFKPFNRQLVVDRLKSIAAAEKIAVSGDALGLIAELGDGSLRDSISLLDQLSAAGKEISLEHVESLAGLAPAGIINRLIEATDKKRPKELVETLTAAYANGFRAEAIASQLAANYRLKLLEAPDVDKLSLIRQLITVAGAYRPEQLLELILLEVSLQTNGDAAVEGGDNAKPLKQEPQGGAETRAADSKPDHTKAEPVRASATKSQPIAVDNKLWLAVLDRLRGHHNTLYGVARMATARVNDDELVLEFAFPFHLNRVNETRNRRIISEIVSELAGRELAVSNRLNPALSKSEPHKPSVGPATEPKAPSKKAKSDNLQTISDVFGGGELL